MVDGFDDGSDGVVSSLLECAEDAHQDCLAVSTALTAIAIAVLADDDGRPNRPFSMVVVEGNRRVVEECEHIVLVTA